MPLKKSIFKKPLFQIGFRNFFVLQWSKFWGWYSRNIEKSILVTLIILLSQVPHFIWGGDILLQSGYIANVHPVMDFVLYGVDLFEIPLIIKTCVDFIVLKRK